MKCTQLAKELDCIIRLFWTEDGSIKYKDFENFGNGVIELRRVKHEYI